MGYKLKNIRLEMELTFENSKMAKFDDTDIKTSGFMTVYIL